MCGQGRSYVKLNALLIATFQWHDGTIVYIERRLTTNSFSVDADVLPLFEFTGDKSINGIPN